MGESKKLQILPDTIKLTNKKSNSTHASTSTKQNIGVKHPELPNSKQLELKTGCWNIRRGLVKYEHEIIELISSQKLDILVNQRSKLQKISNI